MNKGYFITFEGCEGSGKTTQIELLKEKLKNKNFIFTKEPGGSNIGKYIRDLLLNPDYKLDYKSEFFLFMAERNQHLKTVILPALEKGKHVICDRYILSTLAYQCGMNKTPISLIMSSHRSLDVNFLPDIILYLDLCPSIGLKRARKVTYEKESRFDSQPLKYHKEVYNHYNKFKELFNNVQDINASNSIEEINKDILNILKKESVL